MGVYVCKIGNVIHRKKASFFSMCESQKKNEKEDKKRKNHLQKIFILSMTVLYPIFLVQLNHPAVNIMSKHPTKYQDICVYKKK